MLVEAMEFEEGNMTSCVGVTAPTPPPGVCERERGKERVCERERVRERVCERERVGVCVRERERE